MMYSQLPPLKSLLVFAVAARHLNFSKAAEELCITQSAISHQIKRLEVFLGCPLFEKSAGKLVMTKQAQEFSSSLLPPFEQIRRATEQISRKHSEKLNIGASSDFAVRCLMPTLHEWQLKNPTIDMRIKMVSCGDDLEHLDLDIFVGQPIQSSLFERQLLMKASYLLVASKQLKFDHKNKDLLTLIGDTPLLDLDNVKCWQQWASLSGFRLPESARFFWFSHTLLIIEALLAGQGCAIVEQQLIKKELEQEQLTVLTEKPFVLEGYDYYVSWRQDRKFDKNQQKVIEWLKNLVDINCSIN